MLVRTGQNFVLLLLCSAHIAYAVTYELKNSYNDDRYVWATCWIDKENTVAPQGYGEPTESYSSLEEFENGFIGGQTCKIITLGPGTWHGYASQEVDAPSIDMLYCGVGNGFVASCPDDHVIWLKSNNKFDIRVADGSQIEDYTIGTASFCSYSGGNYLQCGPSARGISVAVGLVEVVRSCTMLTIDKPFICRQVNTDTASQSTSTPAGSPQPTSSAFSVVISKKLMWIFLTCLFG